MPAPVLSRRSFTIVAVTFAILDSVGSNDQAAARSAALGYGRGFERDSASPVHAGGDLAFRQTVDHGAGDEVTIKRDGARGVVIAGDRISDAVRIAVGIEDRRHWNAEFARFGNGDNIPYSYRSRTACWADRPFP